MWQRLASALLVLLLTAAPASAYLVEVTTSVAVSDAGDRRVLQEARSWPRSMGC
jgi:hypothetical protein